MKLILFTTPNISKPSVYFTPRAYLISCDQCYQWDSTDLSTLPEAGGCLPPVPTAMPDGLSFIVSLPPHTGPCALLGPGKLSSLFPLDLVKLTRRPSYVNSSAQPSGMLFLDPLPMLSRCGSCPHHAQNNRHFTYTWGVWMNIRLSCKPANSRTETTPGCCFVSPGLSSAWCRGFQPTVEWRLQVLCHVQSFPFPLETSFKSLFQLCNSAGELETQSTQCRKYLRGNLSTQLINSSFPDYTLQNTVSTLFFMIWAVIKENYSSSLKAITALLWPFSLKEKLQSRKWR